MSKFKVGDKVRVQTNNGNKFSGDVHHLIGKETPDPFYAILIKKDHTGKNAHLVGSILIVTEKELRKV